MKPKLTIMIVTIAAVLTLVFEKTIAQNTSPYWSLAGNNNATTSSKLGTTNAIPLRMYTKNTERIRIDTFGNVGIGTTSPAARLHVNSASGNNALLAQVNGSTKMLVHSGGGVAIGSSSTPPANGLFVAGRLGVGNNAPATIVDIRGGNNWDVNASEGDVRIGNSTYRLKIGVATGGAGAGDVRIRAAGGTNRMMIGPNDAFTIAASGFIGIRTATPSYELDVQGTVHSISTSAFGPAVQGEGFYGILGVSNGPDNSGTAFGVRGIGPNGVIGIATGTFGYGVYGNSENGYGVYGSSTNSYAGYFDGDVFIAGSYGPSDRKLKQNIAVLSNAMKLINELQPKEYEYRHDSYYNLMNLPSGKHYGLIAQDLEQVLPTLTKDTKFDTRTAYAARKEDYDASQPSEIISFKAVNYIELIPIILKGMQEQDAKISEQQATLEKQKDKIEALTQLVNQLQNTPTESSVKLSGVFLGQNIPNPLAANSTRINYNIPSDATSAELIFTNVAGQKIKQVQLSNSGFIDINTSAFSTGSYFYTLYINGKSSGSKKMVVNR